jgi:putative ubiquitin-RnfH superfamily antitoxin RatB of RatAB toxin-antitoxin module
LCPSGFSPVCATQSFDFQVVLKAPLNTVFSIYVDVDRWRHRHLFGDLQGKPWEEASRLQIETRQPIRSTIDQVVQHFTAKESLSYLSHVFGTTCETRVTSAPVSVSETAINVTMQLVGLTSRSLGFALAPPSPRLGKISSRSCGRNVKPQRWVRLKTICPKDSRAEPKLPSCGFAAALGFAYTEVAASTKLRNWAPFRFTFMGSSQIRVTVNRPLANVFAIYSQPDTWSWCSYIRSARWVRGRPWEEESRLHLEIDDRTEVDQVLMHFEPRERVEFISHFAGVTLETRVTFRAASENETEIDVQLEFVGVFSRIAGFAIDKAIQKSTLKFFEDLKLECERRPRGLAASGEPGEKS